MVSPATPTSTIAAVCGLCSADCGVALEVAGGVIRSARGLDGHPFTDGYICPKGRALPEIQNAPDRLRRPLLRVDGGLREVSWDQAIAFAADRLLDLRERYGASSVAFHVGRAGIEREFLEHVRRFSRIFGSPDFSCAGSHCHFGTELANVFTYGTLSLPDHGRSDCLVFWGRNPLASAPVLSRQIARAVRGGAKLLVIDPRSTSLARRADLHLRPRPGTDASLALAMLHVIIGEGRYDHDFVREWTVGFDALAEHVRAFSPEATEPVTGVPAAQVAAAARLYADARAASLAQGNALELHRDGVQSARAVACLMAVCGNLDVWGGNLLAVKRPLAWLGKVPLAEDAPLPVGAAEYPLFYRRYREAQANLYADAMLTSPPRLRGLVVAGGNPLVQWPGVTRLDEALGRLELLVVSDLFLTETARRADLVLPATLPVERDELWDAQSLWVEPRLGLSPRAVAPDGLLTDVEFWSRLAHALGYDEQFPWSDDAGALDVRLSPMGLSRDELAARPDGVPYGEQRERKYVTDGFRTPSGKVELVSSVLGEQGFDPLPTPGPASSRDDGAYPLLLSSGARVVGYTHSRYRTIPSLRRLAPEPVLELSPATAATAGVGGGDTAVVSSPHGEVRLKVGTDDDLAPGVATAPHGWESANLNRLTSADPRDLDPVSGFPAFRSLRVAVTRAEEEVAQPAETGRRPA